MPAKRRPFESATVTSFLAMHSNLLYCGRSFLTLRNMAAIGVANDDIEGFGVPDAFLYVLNFWHSVVSTRLLRDLASDQNDAYRMYLIFALG
jgi:hypothetical protein